MAFALPGKNMLHDLVYYIFYRTALFLVLFESYIASGRVLTCAMNICGLLPWETSFARFHSSYSRPTSTGLRVAATNVIFEIKMSATIGVLYCCSSCTLYTIFQMALHLKKMFHGRSFISPTRPNLLDSQFSEMILFITPEVSPPQGFKITSEMYKRCSRLKAISATRDSTFDVL